MKRKANKQLVKGPPKKRKLQKRQPKSDSVIAQREESDSDHLTLEEETSEEEEEEQQLPRRKRKNKGPETRNWFLTWNNYPEDFKERLLALKPVKYCFQEEKGEEDGTPHIQGVFVLKHPKFNHQLQQHIKARWSRCRNIFAAKTYCSKIDTRNGETFVKGFFVKGFKPKLKDPMEGHDYYQWQTDLINIMEGPVNLRKVYWYWSRKGKVGKSAFCKHMCMNDKQVFIIGGTNKDALYSILIKVKKGIYPTTIFIDIPRNKIDKEGNPMISYTALEQIKNGHIFSAKYESEDAMFNPPHIIVFANCAPDQTKMSEDRWEDSIVNINNDAYDFSVPRPPDHESDLYG